jgi:mRNA interferase HigB
MCAMAMHLISRKRLQEMWKTHADAEKPLTAWALIVERATWRSFVELRATFPSADQVGNLTVFNIGGNKFRLIALVDFEFQKLFVRSVLPRADYDKGDWKNDPWF